MPAIPAQTTPRSPRTRPSAKRPANLSLSADVLDAARLLQLNVSQICDNYLCEVVRREQERRWREEHADFIAAYNTTVETEGLPLDGLGSRMVISLRSLAHFAKDKLPTRLTPVTNKPNPDETCFPACVPQCWMTSNA